MPQSNSMVWETARDYARKGIYVNPVRVSRKPDGKKDVRPVGLWRTTSSTSLADIAAWEQNCADAGLLIDTGKSGLVVIDPDGQEGIDAWRELEPPATARVRTPGGGEHWYYRTHPAHVIGNDQNGKVASSVDVRGLGGFVIAPPTSDGAGSWEWIDGPPDWESLPVVPDIVIERMLVEKPRESALSAASRGGDDLFDDAQRRFTEEQAKDFIRKARTVLAGTASGFNGAINNFAMACAHFPWLVSREQCGKHMIKALGEKTGWTEPDADDVRTIESAYSATEAGRSWVAVKVEEPGKPASGNGRLYIESAAEMAYWLQENAGRGRMSGFFIRNGQMVHTPRIGETGYVPAAEGENGPVEIRPVTGPVLAAKLQYLYECWKTVDVKDEAGKKTGEKAEVAALFPAEAAKRAVDAPEALDALRPLRGITSTPMVRADGNLIDVPGYDESSGYLFLPDDGVDVPEVTGLDVEQAGKLLLDMVQDFPFATADDRANYFGLLLTPLLRQVAPPSYKLFGIGAHQPGSGKSMLAEIVSIIHGGVLRTEVPEDEPEWRKESIAILSTTSAPVVVLDNIMGVLKSGTLAAILTAGRELTSRELGTNNKSMTVANDRVWVVTGNNLSIGGDLARRTVTVLIDPDRPDPEQRTDFVVQDLPGWVAENRNQILWALLTLIRAWVMQGMPEPERRQSDSFARWSRIIAGILSVAGIEGTFDDQSGKRVARGGDDDGLALALDALYDRFGDRAFTVAEALEPKAGEGPLIEQRDWLPGSVLDRLGRSEAAGRKAFGWWFRNRIGRWVTPGERPMVIREAGSLNKVALWRIEVR